MSRGTSPSDGEFSSFSRDPLTARSLYLDPSMSRENKVTADWSSMTNVEFPVVTVISLLTIKLYLVSSYESTLVFCLERTIGKIMQSDKAIIENTTISPIFNFLDIVHLFL